MSNRLDDIIGYFSPEKQVKRAQARRALEVLRNYEGAKKGRRTKNWKTTNASANVEIGRDLPTLRDRSRDLVRNNPYIERGIRGIQTNLIGRGIMTQINLSRSKRAERQLQDAYRFWTRSVNFDYDQRSNLVSMQRLISRSFVESGEVFVRRRFVNGPFPIAYQVLESDFLDSDFAPRTEKSTGNRIIQGIELDSDGRRVAYHFFKEHPGNVSKFAIINNRETIRVPADEVYHLYRLDRPGQLRGVPWAAPIMLRTRDLDEYEDAQLVRQKIASCFSVFIHDSQGIDANLTQDEIDEIGGTVEPGIIEVLPNGKTISLANPPGVENYKEYTSVNLHAIASGLGVSYEILTGDLSEVNFSSLKAGRDEFEANLVAWRWDILIPHFMEPITQDFLRTSLLLGINSEGADWSFTPPAKRMVDPVKEVPAKIQEIRGGLQTWGDAVRERGHEPEKQLEEISKFKEQMDEKGIILDSDPDKVDQAGRNQLRDQSRQNENDESEEDE